MATKAPKATQVVHGTGRFVNIRGVVEFEQDEKDQWHIENLRNGAR